MGCGKSKPTVVESSPQIYRQIPDGGDPPAPSEENHSGPPTGTAGVEANSNPEVSQSPKQDDPATNNTSGQASLVENTPVIPISITPEQEGIPDENQNEENITRTTEDEIGIDDKTEQSESKAIDLDKEDKASSNEEIKDDPTTSEVVPSAPTEKKEISDNNEETPSESHQDPEAQEKFNHAIRSFCGPVDPKLVLDLTSGSVRCLHLDRALPGASFPFTELLAKLTTVEELNLSGNQMGPQAFRVIMLAMAANTSIRCLDLSNNKTDTNSSETVGVMLSHNQTLKTLNISGNQLGKDYLSRCIGPALKINRCLTNLCMSSCGATDVTSLLEGLQENTTLTSLDMSHNQISDSTVFAASLSNILQSPSCVMKELNIRNCGIKGSGLDDIGEGLKKNTSLISLHAGGNEMSDLSALGHWLVTCLQHVTMETLNMNDTKCASTDGQEFVNCEIEKKESQMKILHLANCSLTDDIITTVANHMAGCLPRLTELSLSGNTELTMTSLKAVCQLIGKDSSSSHLHCLHLDQLSMDDLPDNFTNHAFFPALQTLSLRRAKMAPSSVGMLHDLVKKPNGLTELCLDGHKLSETEALAQLLNSGENLSLRILSLSGCSLKDSDLSPLTSALGSGWSLTSLTLANNRITDVGFNELLEAILKSEEPCLEMLNLTSNRISDGCDAMLTSLLTRAKNLHSLYLNQNAMGCESLTAMAKSIHLATSLRLLDVRNQDGAIDEDDLEEVFKILAQGLGYTLQQDEYGVVQCGSGPIPSTFSGLTILLTGLGADVGSVGQALDSPMFKTDYGLKHPQLVSLQHALHIGAWMTGQDLMSQPELSESSWDSIIDIKRDSSIPSWLKVSSLRDCAVYFSNLPGSVSASKLEGDLDGEADCNVSEVCIMKDPVQRKPNGFAWVLMADQESVKRAMTYYYTGEALMFNQPYIISPVSLKIPDINEDSNANDKVSEEMARRERERAAEAAEHKELLQASFAASKARHEYAKAHPAYADGRIF